MRHGKHGFEVGGCMSNKDRPAAEMKYTVGYSVYDDRMSEFYVEIDGERAFTVTHTDINSLISAIRDTLTDAYMEGFDDGYMDCYYGG